MAVKKILVIDDDSKNIFALSAVLRSKGYIVVSAAGAEQGLSVLHTDHEIGIILSDIMMPGIDGFDLIHSIRVDNKTKHLPVVAVTGKAMPGDRQKCIEAGADDYISKPVNIDKLISILNKYEIAGSETTD